jgi:hypothetical protein
MGPNIPGGKGFLHSLEHLGIPDKNESPGLVVETRRSQLSMTGPIMDQIIGDLNWAEGSIRPSFLDGLANVHYLLLWMKSLPAVVSF